MHLSVDLTIVLIREKRCHQLIISPQFEIYVSCFKNNISLMIALHRLDKKCIVSLVGFTIHKKNE